jgi:hypothetical protein
MTLGSTKPLTEMSTRNLPGGKGLPARKAENLTIICELILYKIWEHRRLTTLRASTAHYRASFTFIYIYIYIYIFKEMHGDKFLSWTIENMLEVCYSTTRVHCTVKVNLLVSDDLSSV